MILQYVVGVISHKREKPRLPACLSIVYKLPCQEETYVRIDRTQCNEHDSLHPRNARNRHKYQRVSWLPCLFARWPALPRQSVGGSACECPAHPGFDMSRQQLFDAGPHAACCSNTAPPAPHDVDFMANEGVFLPRNRVDRFTDRICSSRLQFLAHTTAAFGLIRTYACSFTQKLGGR